MWRRREVLGLILASPLLACRARPAPPAREPLDIRFQGGAGPVLRERLTAWIRRAAAAVSSYHGRFPVDRVRIEVRVFEGRGIGGGRVVVVSGRPVIHIAVGRFCEPIDFERDWRMTHEMVHLGFPRVAEEHHWIEEGLATYVEPIARARTGWLGEEEVYAEWLDRMAIGQPGPGDRGLDLTPTWARTYWGGALFALAADVEIRLRTDLARGLRDGLGAIARASGGIARVWPLERALAIGDRATGVTVLTEQYRRMARAPAPVDLDALWRRLGIRAEGGRVLLDDRPALRRAILFS
jgi:hypothetical protein